MSYIYSISLYEKALVTGEKIGLAKMKLSKRRMESEARTIIRYIYHDMLGWTNAEAIEHTTPALAELLRLPELVPYLQDAIPDDCPRDDWPGIVTVGLGETIDPVRQLRYYHKQIVAGEIVKFPKELFTGTRGRQKAAILLRSFMTERMALKYDQDIPVERLWALYGKFADTATLNRMLNEAKLYYVYSGLYPHPLAYLHESLDYNDQDDFLYTFFEFQNVYEATKRKSLS